MITNFRIFLRKILGVFLHKQTYLNMSYLLVNIAFGAAYLLVLYIGLLLSWGVIYPTMSILISNSLDWISQLKLVLVAGIGLLIIPVLVPVLQLLVVPEQAMANMLLKESIPLDTSMWSKKSLFLRPQRFFLEPSTWKRLLFILLKIPLGGLSFTALFLVLLPALALLGMPVAYLLGMQNLIIGMWRFDTLIEALLAFLAGLIFVPLSLYIINLMAKVSGWLARTLLLDSKGKSM